MRISELLKRENNNLDFMRLLAAIAVIVGHAYAISPQEGKKDLVLQLLQFDYSGSLAVKFFFFVSGLLVTRSLLEKPSLGGFLISRSFRLFPALFVCVLSSALLIGLLMTSGDISDYLNNPIVHSYIWKNFLLDTQWNLPGVFKQNPISTINGSLWTLPVEFFCYLMLSVLAAIGFYRLRETASVAGLMMVAALAYRPELMANFGLPSEAWQYPVYFLFGSLLAVHANRFDLNLRVIIAFIIMSALLRNTIFYQFSVCISLFLFALWLSGTKIVLSLRLPGDFSYGIYLYGFPMQQISKHLWPGQSVFQNQIVGIGLSIMCAVASWFLVEKFFINLAIKIRKHFREAVVLPAAPM